MDLEVLNQLEQFSLGAEEEGGFEVSTEDLAVNKEECSRSLIGKIFGEKVANYTGLKNTLSTIWALSGSLRIRELGVNLYQFIFTKVEDRARILEGSVWSFDSQFLILKQWSEDTDFRLIKFNSVLLWIQVWNLPNHWHSKAIGFKFKSVFNDVVDVIIPETGSKMGRHLKILAEINLERPLLRGTKLKLKDQTVWVKFRYEKMAAFCFYCGLVGHVEKNCTRRIRDAKCGCLREGQYGEWIKAGMGKYTQKRSSSSKRESLVYVQGEGGVKQGREVGLVNNGKGISVQDALGTGKESWENPKIAEGAGLEGNAIVSVEGVRRMEGCSVEENVGVSGKEKEKVGVGKVRVEIDNICADVQMMGGEGLDAEEQIQFWDSLVSVLVENTDKIGGVEAKQERVLKNISKEVEQRDNIPGKRWNRKKGKENAALDVDRMQGITEKFVTGKRTWSLRDEAESEDDCETGNKRRRGQEGNVRTVLNGVEEASHKWP